MATVWGWETFFEEVTVFLQQLERQEGRGSQQFSEYALERLQVTIVNITNIRDIIASSQSIRDCSTSRRSSQSESIVTAACTCARVKLAFLRMCNGTGHAMSVWGGGGGGGGGPGTIFVISSIIENLSTPRREIRPCVEKISPPCVEKLLQESLHPASEFSTLRREFSTLRREATIFVTNGVP